MHRKLSAILLILSGLPAAAQDLGPRLQQVTQGVGVTVGGRAHIQRAAEGTYIAIQNPNLSTDVYGFIAFGNQTTFPDLFSLEGRNVEITGLIVMNGRAIIEMNDPRQLRLKRS
jgi:hypothetical protein